MPLSHGDVEAIAQWCGSTPALAKERAEARRLFFGEDDPRPVRYLPGGDDHISRERRFLGWFAFGDMLPSGERPAARALRGLFRGSQRAEALRSLEGVRYLTAIVQRVRLNWGFVLELEEERFRVRFPAMSYSVVKENVMVCHVLPLGRDDWLLTPGWLILPYRFGPGMREHLREYQSNPIEMERFLQGRLSGDDHLAPQPPRDRSLSRAVARMTAAAKAEGRPGLVLSSAEWQRLLQPLIAKRDLEGLAREVLTLAEGASSPEEANKWLDLALNIWNNTPQPDRGGKSGNQLIREAKGAPQPGTAPSLEIRRFDL